MHWLLIDPWPQGLGSSSISGPAGSSRVPLRRCVYLVICFIPPMLGLTAMGGGRISPQRRALAVDVYHSLMVGGGTMLYMIVRSLHLLVILISGRLLYLYCALGTVAWLCMHASHSLPSLCLSCRGTSPHLRADCTVMGLGWGDIAAPESASMDCSPLGGCTFGALWYVCTGWVHHVALVFQSYGHMMMMMMMTHTHTHTHTHTCDYVILLINLKKKFNFEHFSFLWHYWHLGLFGTFAAIFQLILLIHRGVWFFRA